MTYIRLFIALPLSQKAKHSLSRIAKKITIFYPSCSLEPDKKYHTTIKFIGWSDHPFTFFVRPIEKIVKNTKPFSCTISSLNIFSGKNAVVYAKIEENKTLTYLYKQIEQVMYTKCDIPRDKRTFLPHVTLARRAHIQKKKAQTILSHITFAPISFTVDSLILFQSILTRKGSRYIPLYTFYFKKEE